MKHTARAGVFLWSFILLLISINDLHAEVRLPQILGDHMVLQREQPVKIWGWADSGERVTVTFNGQSQRTRTGRDGRWMITLDPMEAGGPFRMEIKGENTVVFENILIGDVWICSGQSNMERSVANSNDAEEEIAAADYPRIRLFEVPRNVQLKPVEDIPSGEWNECSPEAVRNFSAVGYYFGRHLHRKAGIPIGLISTNWGGTNVETWTSREMAETDPELREALKELDGMNMGGIIEQRQKERKKLLESLGALESGMKDGKAIWAGEDVDLDDWGRMEVPGLWESNGLPGVDGVVWFRRTVELTAPQADGEVTLRLGAIDDSDRTWINGIEAGATGNAYDKERIYRVDPGVLGEGENTLVVRVEDTGGGGGFWSDPEVMQMTTTEGSIPLAGEWRYRVSAESFLVNAPVAVHPNSLPTLLYNGMIHPLIPFSVQGAIWYQGESNAGRAYRYRTLFPNLIRDWRNKWEDPDLGFYFVQLANFRAPKVQPGESDWAELREAQAMALDLPGTGMAVTIDIGEADDIHPRNKQDVGKRLALAALHDTYGRDVVYSGPVFNTMEVVGTTAVVEFDPMDNELVVRDRYGYVKGFAIAGDDREFHWARGRLEGNRIYLESEHVDDPVAVRYGWADNPDDANLYNAEGLPASPFRTDDWPGITFGK